MSDLVHANLDRASGPAQLLPQRPGRLLSNLSAARVGRLIERQTRRCSPVRPASANSESASSAVKFVGGKKKRAGDAKIGRASPVVNSAARPPGASVSKSRKIVRRPTPHAFASPLEFCPGPDSQHLQQLQQARKTLDVHSFRATCCCVVSLGGRSTAGRRRATAELPPASCDLRRRRFLRRWRAFDHLLR